MTGRGKKVICSCVSINEADSYDVRSSMTDEATPPRVNLPILHTHIVSKRQAMLRRWPVHSKAQPWRDRSYLRPAKIDIIFDNQGRKACQVSGPLFDVKISTAKTMRLVQGCLTVCDYPQQFGKGVCKCIRQYLENYNWYRYTIRMAADAVLFSNWSAVTLPGGLESEQNENRAATIRSDEICTDQGCASFV